MLQQHVQDFIRQGQPNGFEDLALAAFRFQHRNVEALRRLCDGRGFLPNQARRWQDIPLVPAAAFKSVPLSAGPARHIFRSSGTTRGPAERSVHYLPFPDLYREAIDQSFPGACLPGPAPLPMLSLVPLARHRPDSSLSFMIDHVLRHYATADSDTVIGLLGPRPGDATAWAEAHGPGSQPVVILATALALVEWLEQLKREDRTVPLPADSVIFETGGFKGTTREVRPEELIAQVGQRFGIPAQRIVREYGMTELSSQFYTRALAGGDPEVFVAPPWVRVRMLDPESLEEVPAGNPGLVSVLDLANLGSAIHVLTEDLGVGDSQGFRLLGRAAGAELRGCSLTVEELSR